MGVNLRSESDLLMKRDASLGQPARDGNSSSVADRIARRWQEGRRNHTRRRDTAKRRDRRRVIDERVGREDPHAVDDFERVRVVDPDQRASRSTPNAPAIRR